MKIKRNVVNKVWKIRKIFADEKGKFTIEATIICIYIIMITMGLISGIVNIHNNTLETRKEERGRNMTAIEAFKKNE